MEWEPTEASSPPLGSWFPTEMDRYLTLHLHILLQIAEDLKVQRVYYFFVPVAGIVNLI